MVGEIVGRMVLPWDGIGGFLVQQSLEVQVQLKEGAGADVHNLGATC